LPLVLALAACSAAPASPGSSPSLAAPASPGSSPSLAVPTAPAISPGGGTIFFGRAVAGHDAQFVLMSPDGSNEHELGIPTFDCAQCGVGSPDGRFIAVPVESEAGVGTAVMEVTGEGYMELPRPPGLSLAPRSWSPKSDHLAFDGWSDEDPTRIGTWTSAPDGSDLKQIVVSPDGRHYIPMGYSPDGRLLLLHRDGGTSFDMAHAGDLFVVGAEGGELRQLNPARTVAVGFDGVGFNPASWSPDSASVAFGGLDMDGADGKSAVFVTDVDTLASRQVSAWTRWDVYARWSPTGDWIAFDASPRAAGTRLISIVKPDGTDERALTAPDKIACCVDWSPDGRFLVHQRGPEGTSDLWVMDLEGHATQVTDTPGTYMAVWWLP
jgi:Tol biopolymer transport system component